MSAHTLIFGPITLLPNITPIIIRLCGLQRCMQSAPFMSQLCLFDNLGGIGESSCFYGRAALFTMRNLSVVYYDLPLALMTTRLKCELCWKSGFCFVNKCTIQIRTGCARDWLAVLLFKVVVLFSPFRGFVGASLISQQPQIEKKH